MHGGDTEQPVQLSVSYSFLVEVKVCYAIVNNGLQVGNTNRIGINENTYLEKIVEFLIALHSDFLFTFTQKMLRMANKLLVYLTDLFPVKPRPIHLFFHQELWLNTLYQKEI